MATRHGGEATKTTLSSSSPSLRPPAQQARRGGSALRLARQRPAHSSSSAVPQLQLLSAGLSLGSDLRTGAGDEGKGHGEEERPGGATVQLPRPKPDAAAAAAAAAGAGPGSGDASSASVRDLFSSLVEEDRRELEQQLAAPGPLGTLREGAAARSQPGGGGSPHAAAHVAARQEGPGQEAEAEPEPPALWAFARYLGMDVRRDRELLWIAQQAMTAELPSGWREHATEEGEVYFATEDGTRSLWEHPTEAHFRRLYAELRALKQGREDSIADTSLRPTWGGVPIVRQAFPSWRRSILTDIYLCRTCSCQEILRMETPGQALHDHQATRVRSTEQRRRERAERRAQRAAWQEEQEARRQRNQRRRRRRQHAAVVVLQRAWRRRRFRQLLGYLRRRRHAATLIQAAARGS
eukprot:COSAG01_NODE_10420_length_2170_cov_4.053114_1_plen_409_part_00